MCSWRADARKRGSLAPLEYLCEGENFGWRWHGGAWSQELPEAWDTWLGVARALHAAGARTDRFSALGKDRPFAVAARDLRRDEVELSGSDEDAVELTRERARTRSRERADEAVAVELLSSPEVELQRTITPQAPAAPEAEHPEVELVAEPPEGPRPGLVSAPLEQVRRMALGCGEAPPPSPPAVDLG